MLRKAGILIAVVMLMAFTAGVSLASDFLTYRDAGANYFPTAGIVSASIGGHDGLVPGADVYGNSLIDGMETGVANGLPTNVFVNPQGLGDALIYGYYNVRNSETVVFNVTNTADYGVRATIRFKEAKYSCEVLDFHICLSAHDVWHGIITQDAGGTGILNAINIDVDTPIALGEVRGLTPTSSPVSSGMTFGQHFPDGELFKTGSCVASERFTGSVTADMTLEGYWEIIALNRLDEDGLGTLCGYKFGDDTNTALTDNLTEVGNVLFGNAYIIAGGDIYAYQAVALGDWSNQVYINAPTDTTPDLDNGGDAFIADPVVWDNICPVNFVLAKDTVKQNYFNFGLGTEFIVNFPTKGLTPEGDVNCDPFDADADGDVPVGAIAYDDQERSVDQGCTTSPCTSIPTPHLPWEVNVVSIDSGKIFDSAVEEAITTQLSRGLGYLVLDFHNTPLHNANRVNTWNGATSHGLPAIGFVVTNVLDVAGPNWMLPLVYTNFVTVP